MSYIALDIGGTKVLGALFSEKETLIERYKKKTKAHNGKKTVIKQISKVVRHLVEEAGDDKVRGLGCGIPGIINAEEGIVVFSPNLPLKKLALADLLQNEFQFPVSVGNDVNVGTLGEWKYGAGKKVDDLIGIFVGTGLGGGLVLRGKLYDGVGGSAGEIGHMCVNPGGPPCGCGSRGCIETYASKQAIMNALDGKMKRGVKTILSDSYKKGSVIHSDAIAKGLEARDPVTMEVLGKMTDALAIGVANYLNILNVGLVIFGGGLMESIGEELLPAIRKKAAAYAMPGVLEDARFTVAKLGDDAALYGSLYLAKHGGSE